MSFSNSYKHLDKLCSDCMHDRRGITAYIEEMQNTPQGYYYVPSWNEDLKMLKHYRWVRNQIAHEPDCDEQNMCVPADAQWLEHFYRRMMNQTDPLALYRQATATQNKKPSCSDPADTPSAKQDDEWSAGYSWLPVLVLVLLMILFTGFIFYMLIHG